MRIFVPREDVVWGREHEDLVRNVVATLLTILGHEVFDWPDEVRNLDRAICVLSADAIFLTLCNPKSKPRWALCDVHLDVPKIQLVGDFHYETTLDSYAGADLLLLRYPTAVARACEMAQRGIRNVTWLRHSFAPEAVPATAALEARCPRVAVIGNLVESYYPTRLYATRALRDNDLAFVYDAVANPVKSLTDYFGMLATCEAGLSCGSIFGFPVAKTVEIPAAGGLLFTDDPIGTDEYLPRDLYVTYNVDNVVDKAKALLGTAELRERAQRARKYVYQHHTHSARAEELRSLLAAL
jgi:hypothetical protein